MAQPAFNIGAFVSTLFLLEFGADKFIAHTAIVANRIGVSEVIIGLLTAGAEWEEVSIYWHFQIAINTKTSVSWQLSSPHWRRAGHP